MRRALILVGLAGLLATAFVFGFEVSARNRSSSAQPAESVVDAVRADLASRYYRPVPGSVLRLGSVQSMIAALDDPYTEYLDGASYRLLQRRLAGSYSGIGVTLLPAPSGLLVVATEPGPGRVAGLRVGDTITRIDSTPTPGLGLAGALARIAGPRGTTVRLVVLRRDVVRGVEVRRATVRAPGVSGRRLSFGGRTYGYLRVTTFRHGTAGRLAAEIRHLKRAGVDGLVLDLRENPGGLLDEAVKVSSLFLRHGTVVSLVGAHHPLEVYSASGHPLAPKLPLTVLVDRFSASAAEVVAAALHDNGRATLVGDHTYGKAVVQSIDPLANGGALALTTARYFTPAGRDISRVGVRPDVRVLEDERTPLDDGLAAGLATLAAATS
jgi:carboxyl-terminal processing protease